MNVTWRSLLRDAEDQIGPAEARWILEQASGMEGPELALGLDASASSLGIASVERMVTRRAAGEPLQYVLGRWEFRTLDLLVDPRVLIPRPETEAVVEHLLVELDCRRADWVGADPGARLLGADLGTGSGAIALSLVTERDGVEVWATDASPDAIAVARANLAGAGKPSGRVRLAEGDWFGALAPELAGQLHFIVSNPPYVADAEILPSDVVGFEPRSALFAGPSGLEAVDEIVRGAPAWLRPDGLLVVEIAPHQADDVRTLAIDAGYGSVRIADDLTGRPRCLIATP